MSRIAPSAHVDPQAQLGDDVEIGHGCYVGPQVVLGAGCRLMPNVTLLGRSEFGPGNAFYPGAVLGANPQDLKFKGGDTRLVVGRENIFRECCTVHVGTESGGGITRIGDHNQFQVGSHIAHDVSVGSHCVLSNSVQIAGHVHIEDSVNISGLVGVQQFVTIGRFSFIAGLTRCATDVPPFLVYGGYDGAVMSVNEVGLRRWGFNDEQVAGIWALYKAIYSRKAGAAARTMADRLALAERNGPLAEHQSSLIEFIKRSMHDGVAGRYRESLRRESKLHAPGFYQRS